MARRKSDKTEDFLKKRRRGLGMPGAIRVLILVFKFIYHIWPLLALAAVGFFIWRNWTPIFNWMSDTTNATIRIFGWGLLIIAAVIIVLAFAVSRGYWASFYRRWNRWLSGLVAATFVWGFIAFFNPGGGSIGRYGLGGQIGRGIIGHTGWEGLWRLVLILLIAVALMAPRWSYRTVRAGFSWILEQLRQPGLRRLPRPRTAPHLQHLVEELEEEPETEPERPYRRQPVEPPIPFPSETQPMKRERRKEPKSAPATASRQKELKQVAQDVWKKYGESPSVVTVNGWKLPPIDILDIAPEVTFSQADNVERGHLIEQALASYGVEAKVVQINTGPTVTQFGLEPGWDRKYKEVREKDKDGNVSVIQREVSKTRVKVDRISSLSNDLSLALAAPSIRIEAPVPGKAIVGIEVPNTIASTVSLRAVIESSQFQKMQAKVPLAMALGKGAGGEAVVGDIAKMPHLLIAGATGSGKTVCLNTIICCLLMNNPPSDLRFIMVDPKRVELTGYNSIPHLVTPVIVEADKALQALRGLSREMNERYQTLATGNARNIQTYNKNRQGDDRMPYLVLVIDELADLMALGGDEVEQILCRLAQLSRAVGIHLIVATQRPSVDVVTGLIKANFPTRISFAVTSQVDSRTILDFAGAEKLLGSGDMLYMPTDASKPKRLQGCYVSDAEAERLVYFWGSQKRQETTRKMKIEEIMTQPVTAHTAYPEDKLLQDALELAKEHDTISTSFLQRRLHIGYPRAARLFEQVQAYLEAQGHDEPEYVEDDGVLGGDDEEWEEEEEENI